MKSRIGEFASRCVLLTLPFSAVAGPVFEITVEETQRVGTQIVIKETGNKGDLTYVWPTHNGGRFIPKDGGAGRIGLAARLDTPVPNHPRSGSHIFKLDSVYRGVKVTDYDQQTADPAILQAAAFESGIMVDSLWDWLVVNGYGADHPIFQPDFFLVGGGDVYYAVDLAALGAAGATFVDSWDLGSIFSLNASSGLDEMPFYMFSSTPFEYSAGVGWAGGTPLAAGAQLSFDAFHETSAIPEPITVLLVGVGIAAVALWRKGDFALAAESQLELR